MAVRFPNMISLFVFYFIVLCHVTNSEDLPSATFRIEGKVSIVGGKSKTADWLSETSVLVNGGDYKGFLKSDGSFVVNSIPSGSHLIEVASPNYEFPRYRVDITKGGKIRARHVNFLQPNAVQVVPYPLRFVATRPAAFFEIREQWKVTDLLYNPMILMMLLPVLFVFVMPKLMSMADPEAQKEMQSQMNVFNNKQKLPELSEVFSNLFGGPETKKKKGTSSAGDKGVARKMAGKRR